MYYQMIQFYGGSYIVFSSNTCLAYNTVVVVIHNEGKLKLNGKMSLDLHNDII